MMLRASIIIEENSPEEAEIVYNAAFYGENVRDSRVNVSVGLEGEKIRIEVEAKDPVALRAVLNTVLRNYKLICSLRDV